MKLRAMVLDASCQLRASSSAVQAGAGALTTGDGCLASSRRRGPLRRRAGTFASTTWWARRDVLGGMCWVGCAGRDVLGEMCGKICAGRDVLGEMCWIGRDVPGEMCWARWRSGRL